MGNSYCGAAETNLTSIHEDAGSIPGLTQWVEELTLPRAVVQVADTALIPSLAQKPPQAMGVALKKKKKRQKKTIKINIGSEC